MSFVASHIQSRLTPIEPTNSTEAGIPNRHQKPARRIKLLPATFAGLQLRQSAGLSRLSDTVASVTKGRFCPKARSDVTLQRPQKKDAQDCSALRLVGSGYRAILNVFQC